MLLTCSDYSKLMSSETLDISPSISCSPSDVVTTVEKGANGGGGEMELK